MYFKCYFSYGCSSKYFYIVQIHVIQLRAANWFELIEIEIECRAPDGVQLLVVNLYWRVTYNLYFDLVNVMLSYCFAFGIRGSFFLSMILNFHNVLSVSK